MKAIWSHLDQFRFRKPPFDSPDGERFGMFHIPVKVGAVKTVLRIMACDAEETQWEHVSVSKEHGTPSWEEMCFVKDLFWNEDETVLQIHPPKSEYVNNHARCLHLWKSAISDIELPPSELIGIKELGTIKE